MNITPGCDLLKEQSANQISYLYESRPSLDFWGLLLLFIQVT